MPSIIAGSQPLLGPLVGLVGWTFVMEGWMYLYRLPAMSKYNVDASPGMTKEHLNAKIPRHLQYPADNFNHLMEQPTQFYAIVLALNQLGVRDSLTVQLAWTYVGLRIVHSLVQSTTNHILIRFSIFLTSSAVLLGMTAQAARIFWQ
ncbi:hypothetical protein BAUCODRAFT_120826 [Baudoinia panamericana UAMH 10762]|uniref:MAPEG family protein n=1 Tax=Baudoinia panamericana (strain UAMH 10762) TaxID=717646 RepID=M2NFY4_BAUPA|nr:uncharacterized protein BAUCODRAFT_120826 [Baudoinia panamericana UAMH 10762]EMC97905.1 hypothetical protein BAUCODRAFT_120826 [Baudoinia panamericana UAMH 10762]